MLQTSLTPSNEPYFLRYVRSYFKFQSKQFLKYRKDEREYEIFNTRILNKWWDVERRECGVYGVRVWFNVRKSGRTPFIPPFKNYIDNRLLSHYMRTIRGSARVTDLNILIKKINARIRYWNHHRGFYFCLYIYSLNLRYI